MGGAEPAYQLWRSFCPALRGAEPDAYRAEPYVMPGNVDGPLSSLPGRGGWTWYTGSAGWCLRAMIEGVLGVAAEDGALRVAGDLPDSWERFRLRRQYRGATYEIVVRRAGAGERPGRSADGSPFQEERLPLAAPGATVAVEIIV
jgi:cellobiose phosphorylase